MQHGARRRQREPAGITLVEVLVGVSIFLTFSLATAQVVTNLARLNSRSASRVVATAIANEQVEVIRNLKYGDVGTVGGLPPGVIPQSKTILRNNRTFTVMTTIRSIDDPFDGTISGNPPPVDTAPGDYRQVDVLVTCSSCPEAPATRLVTTVAPNGLEISSGNGALFIRVIDALAQPVSGATVRITNAAVVPAVDLTDTTGASGELQLVDVPPAATSYHITVTKAGFSSDGTIVLTPENPNPTTPDATVAAGTVTVMTFAIDVLSPLAISTTSTFCAPQSGVQVHLAGTKLVGTNPDVLKFVENATSDATGHVDRTLEWGTYNLTVTDQSDTLIGTVGTLPVILNPGAAQNLSLILGSPTTNGLHVTVKDATSLQPISGAAITVTRPGFSVDAETGRGYLRQTDWSGGAGQENFVDETAYQSDDGGADAAGTAGQLTLARVGNDYLPSAVLTSSTFDTGGATNFINVSWSPVSQPPEAGAESLRFQIATNDDNTTWNYLGPDGTPLTYYTASNSAINASHNGRRYLRYRVTLGTADVAVTPVLADVAVSFTSGCVPPGQVFFSGLTANNYSIDTTAAGYDADSRNVTVNGWTSVEVLLTPS